MPIEIVSWMQVTDCEFSLCDWQLKSLHSGQIEKSSSARLFKFPIVAKNTVCDTTITICHSELQFWIAINSKNDKILTMQFKSNFLVNNSNILPIYCSIFPIFFKFLHRPVWFWCWISWSWFLTRNNRLAHIVITSWISIIRTRIQNY